ncbi:uroporphyrinogen-III synthase [Rubrivirga litoralis]|uniref:Uroporphyrinogen-III synthase n=1 Tax=Rubrivirga litoralis TaxID=3075598 RepID=A0ABU3BTV3_9BACT|nr:uroporphyrinogen-III synthase [Rubrivirga sp. F394]MDT0632707.1 uroporphyrinogen-III synthase [Rubrivirga sp. F394]
MSRAPLQGRRVVVTRAEDQAGTLVDGLRERGAEPLLVPALRFLPPPRPDLLAEAARGLGGPDTGGAAWVVFTSAVGVRFGWAAVREAGGLPAGIRVAAIGSGTAEALEAAGSPVDFVPREALGDVLIEELPLAEGDRVVLLRSDIGREAIATGLAARGAVVEDVTAYRTVSEADPAAAAAALAQTPDAITFTSPSTVRGFLGALTAPPESPAPPERPLDLGGAALVAIGPVTAEALAPFGLEADAVADPHTVSGLLDTLVRLFS